MFYTLAPGIKTADMRSRGLHTGVEATMVIEGAREGSGIRFIRHDAEVAHLSEEDRTVPASYKYVDGAASSFCTFLRGPSGVSVQTPEHVLSGLTGMGIYDAVIHLDGPEVPILDGSSMPVVEALLPVTGRYNGPYRGPYIKVRKPVEVVTEPTAQAKLGSRTMLLPCRGAAPTMTFTSSFAVCGEQSFTLDMGDAQHYIDEVARARTFATLDEIRTLQKMGMAKGGSPDNAMIIDAQQGIVLNGREQWPNEVVRHKTLDAVGDINGLAGMPVWGDYVGVYSGHSRNNMVLRKLLVDGRAGVDYEIVSSDEVGASRVLGDKKPGGRVVAAAAL